MNALFLISMQIRFERNRTSTVIVMFSLYLYFLGLSLRNTSKALVIFRDENKRSYVSVWNWIQRFGSCQIYKRIRVYAFRATLPYGDNPFNENLLL
jgi:hypothetical protein